jgi:hypothetical protein
MRHPTFLAIVLISIRCVAQTQTPESSSFLTNLQNMPSQIRSGTFDSQAFRASEVQAETDTNLDLHAVCRLLEADVADANLQVSGRAAAVLGELVRRNTNTEADRQLLAPALLSCVDKSKDQGAQLVCSTQIGYRMPMSAIVQFKDLAARKIADGTAYSALAVGLALLARSWPNVNIDPVLAEFFRSPSVPDDAKTRAIFSLQNMQLSDSVLDAVAELLSKTKSDELKLQIIQVSPKLGGRAMEREHNTLLALEANLSEGEHVRQAAGYALRVTVQGSTTNPGIH